MVRTAYTLRAEDDDWGQAGTLVRDVMNDADRDRLVANIVGDPLNGSYRLGPATRLRLLAQRRRGTGRARREGRAHPITASGRHKSHACGCLFLDKRG